MLYHFQYDVIVNCQIFLVESSHKHSLVCDVRLGNVANKMLLAAVEEHLVIDLFKERSELRPLFDNANDFKLLLESFIQFEGKRDFFIEFCFDALLQFN